MRAAAVERLGRLGPSGRGLARRIDLLAATGPRYFLRRLWHRRTLERLGEEARNSFYEQMWRQAATELGASAVRLGPGLLELSRGAAKTRVFQQVVALDDPVTLKIALDKALVHERLASAGVTVPEHVQFSFGAPAGAIDFLEHARGPCVVKPAAGTGGGNGTTAGITTPIELLRARLHAAGSGDRLLIERQAEGPVYRLLLLEGRLLDVVRSRPARLTGDGRSTIAKLLNEENRRRADAEGAAGLSRVGVNLDMVLALQRAGLSLAAVLPAGRAVEIRTITSGNGAACNETYTGAIAEEVVNEARAAADAVGLKLAGVDVITPDPERPLLEVGGVINEVNGTPGLHHHYLVADPERATRVAVPILERLLDRS